MKSSATSQLCESFSRTHITASWPDSNLTRHSHATAIYLSPGLRSASQMAYDNSSLYVSYKMPDAKEVMTRQPSMDSYHEMRSVPDRLDSGDVRNRNMGSMALDEEEEYDDDENGHTSPGSHNSSLSSTKYNEAGPWDDHIEELTYNGSSEYRCTWVSHDMPGCCNKMGSRHTVKRHVKVVHLKIRPFSCSYCPLAFGSRSALATHTNTHTGEKPNICPDCHQGFGDPAGLYRHKKKKHNYQPHFRKPPAVYNDRPVV